MEKPHEVFVTTVERFFICRL